MSTSSTVYFPTSTFSNVYVPMPVSSSGTISTYTGSGSPAPETLNRKDDVSESCGFEITLVIVKLHSLISGVGDGVGVGECVGVGVSVGVGEGVGVMTTGGEGGTFVGCGGGVRTMFGQSTDTSAPASMRILTVQPSSLVIVPPSDETTCPR